MRNLATLLLAIVVLVPAARAATVEVAHPHITFLSTDAATVACGAPLRRGCTTLKTEFFCNCVHDAAADQWSLAVHIVATPYVYTTTQDIMTHELQHISDLRTSLNEYASTLLMHSFPTEARCTSFMQTEKTIFADTMRNIQRVTVLRRDGSIYAERIGDH
jgi:hypothetical protein